MPRLTVLVTLATLAALTLAMPAAAKGPESASLSGPGLRHAIAIKGYGEGGRGTPLGSLVELGGFFPQVFARTPDPVARTRPHGDLGPRYRIVYRVPGPNSEGNTIVQAVYPYAKPNPVTHVRAGQRFWGSNYTYGGWFIADPALKATLVKAGLPASPPPPPAPLAPRAGSSFPWVWAAVGTAAAVLLLLVAGGLRRRGAI